MSCEVFPVQANAENNPAIRLFGRRLFNDQLPLEFLLELLLVIRSPKRIGDASESFTTPLPAFAEILTWRPRAQLHYAPKARLNLKLFAFMGASRLDSRHESHREHYKELLERLEASTRVPEPGGEGDVLRALENLLLGFQGSGFGRTWCAQNFLPVCPAFLAGETLWNETAAFRQPPQDWGAVLDSKDDYLAMNKHRFLARGGEVLYLQICNALRVPEEKLRAWAEEAAVHLEPEELNPASLQAQLQGALGGIFDQCPSTVSEIAEFIDSGVESATAAATDTERGEPHFVAAGCCAAESWREGYLFAVDLLRVCKADLDLIERLQLLESACAVQVLRSLGAQSARQLAGEQADAWPGYRLVVTAPGEAPMALKRLSRNTAKGMEKLIYRAIRHDWTGPADEEEREKLLKEADRRYGGKLFIGLAKRIGLMVPRRGAGARFTLNERLLRLLVVTTVPVGGRMTFDRFKRLVEARHGWVFDAEGFERASAWLDGSRWRFGKSDTDEWLPEMLEAAGLLIQLSDSCALVENPTTRKGEAA